MENYQKAYLKLFNAMTGLIEEAKELAGRMEMAQAECEEMIINGPKKPLKMREKIGTNENNPPKT